MLTGHERQIGRWAWVMAWVGLVVGQLHALARFSVPEHAEDITDYPLTAAWAEPAMDVFSPLLTWGDPDLVYVTYGKIWFPVFVAFTLCAAVVHRRRGPRGFEKWAWRAGDRGVRRSRASACSSTTGRSGPASTTCCS